MVPDHQPNTEARTIAPNIVSDFVSIADAADHEVDTATIIVIGQRAPAPNVSDHTCSRHNLCALLLYWGKHPRCNFTCLHNELLTTTSCHQVGVERVAWGEVTRPRSESRCAFDGLLLLNILDLKSQSLYEKYVPQS